MAENFRYQVRTNNKSNRIVRKYRNGQEIPEGHDDMQKFIDMICDKLYIHEEGNLKWVITP